MVALAKLGDGVAREVTPRSGTNTVPVRFIGGMPVRPVEGPLIRVANMRVNLPEEKGMNGPRRTVEAVAVAVEPHGTGRDAEGGKVPSFRGVVITAEGGRYPAGPLGSMEHVRREWIRFALADGTFAGLARMR